MAGNLEITLSTGTKAMDLHQLSHALFASLNATRRKLTPDTWPAISVLHLIENRLDVDQQCHITGPAAGLQWTSSSRLQDTDLFAGERRCSNARKRSEPAILRRPDYRRALCEPVSLSTIEPVSAPPKWKLKNGEQRPAPETRPARTEIPEIADQRLGRPSLTRRNVGDSHTPGNNTPETGLPG